MSAGAIEGPCVSRTQPEIAWHGGWSLSHGCKSKFQWDLDARFQWQTLGAYGPRNYADTKTVEQEPKGVFTLVTRGWAASEFFDTRVTNVKTLKLLGPTGAHRQRSPVSRQLFAAGGANAALILTKHEEPIREERRPQPIRKERVKGEATNDDSDVEHVNGDGMFLLWL